MLHRDLADLLELEPFEPFRVRLLNGSHYDIVHPQTVTLLRGRVFLALTGGDWVIFRTAVMASIESLLEDFGAGPPSE